MLWVYNHDVSRMMFLARMPIVFLCLGLALICFQFARQFWGQAAALPAFLLALFEPNILAHGRYTTTDVGATIFVLLATFLLWRLWHNEQRKLGSWAFATFGLGLALASKLSALAFVPIWALMALIPVQFRRQEESYWPAAGRRLLLLVGAGLFSFVIVWAIFGFEWGALHFQSPKLQSLNGIEAPMPTYWAGIEKIAGVTGSGRGNTFLLGEISESGFSAYFPVAFLSKTPLPILFLLPLSVAAILIKKRSRCKGLFLLLPAVLYFGVSVQSALNIGYRHLLPMVPFLLLLITGLAVDGKGAEVKSGKGKDPRQGGWRWLLYSRRGWLTIAITWLIALDLWIHPHYLSYFNLVAGGPENGYNVLVDSNIDWGQDLLRLKRWMGDHNVSQVSLAWFGSADPGYYGIQYRALPGLGRDPFFPLWWDVPFDRSNPEPGVYAISATNLWELPLRKDERTVYAWFRAREPDDKIGYSILIYDVP